MCIKCNIVNYLLVSRYIMFTFYLGKKFKKCLYWETVRAQQNILTQSHEDKLYKK